MQDLPVKPHRKTLKQTAIILNVSDRTVRRYLDNGRLEWSGNQVSVASITKFLQTLHEDESAEEIEAKFQAVTSKGRKQLSPGI